MVKCQKVENRLAFISHTMFWVKLSWIARRQLTIFRRNSNVIDGSLKHTVYIE